MWGRYTWREAPVWLGSSWVGNDVGKTEDEVRYREGVEWKAACSEEPPVVCSSPTLFFLVISSGVFDSLGSISDGGFFVVCSLEATVFRFTSERKKLLGQQVAVSSWNSKVKPITHHPLKTQVSLGPCRSSWKFLPHQKEVLVTPQTLIGHPPSLRGN